MDITSYLLGKNASSGGGGGGGDEYFIQTLTENTTNNDRGPSRLVKKIPQFTLGDGVTELINFYNNCNKLEEIPLINTSNITNMSGMHSNCIKLVSLPQYDTSKVTNMNRFAYICTALENVPVYNWSSVTNLTQIFKYCPELTDESLDNIMQSCISATSFAGTKTFYSLIGTDYPKIYPASRLEALPHYQAFLDAGWTLS